MNPRSLNTLVASLRAPSLRVRTGIWLLRPSDLGQERNEAARLGIDAVDLRSYLLEQLPPDTRYAGLHLGRVLGLCDSISTQPEQSNCVLIYNLDLLLARLPQIERQEFWQQLHQAFPHRPHALLIAILADATELLPKDIFAWESASRLARSA